MLGEKPNIKEVSARLRCLAVFRQLLENQTLSRLLALWEAEPAERPGLYCHFVASLYEEGGDLGSLLLRLCLESGNPVVRLRAAGQEVPPYMERALAEELAGFTALSLLPPEDFASLAAGPLRQSAVLPIFQNTYYDFSALYTRRLAEISTRGYGIFTASHMFTLGVNGALCPVQKPDPQRLSELIGYERERGAVQMNTRALLRGLPAANILLYGDAGTGKSSTVKALANEYKDRGLRLVEVRKDQIYHIPGLMGQLADNPLKFILFIDDLSFPHDDADFTALKAILEGNVAARPGNIVVYATSNRRHMLRQMNSDRLSDELSLSDTLEEEASLSARFGLTVTFLRPGRDLFAEIVRQLAKEYDLRTPPEELLAKAEVHVLRQGGRSPRAARQFIELMKAGEEDGPDGFPL